MTAPTLNFNPTMAHIPDRDLYLAPTLQEYLRGFRLPDPITITLAGHSRPRRASGWFSPSTHPTMGERQLYLYASDPENWHPQPFDHVSQISAMMGTIFHEIFNIAFVDMEILVPPEDEVCPICHRPRGRVPGVDTCNEHAVIDPVLKRRGHIDDIVMLPERGRMALDVKTASLESMRTINNHDLGIFDNPTELKAKYYGQVQEYMALMGPDVQEFMLLFVGMGRPWEIKELIVPRNQPYIDALLAKYRRVRQAVERGVMPEACCKGTAAKMRECPATRCPVKLD